MGGGERGAILNWESGGFVFDLMWNDKPGYSSTACWEQSCPELLGNSSWNSVLCIRKLGNSCLMGMTPNWWLTPKLFGRPQQSITSMLKMSMGVFQTRVLFCLCAYESRVFGHASWVGFWVLLDLWLEMLQSWPLQSVGSIKWGNMGTASLQNNAVQ